MYILMLGMKAPHRTYSTLGCSTGSLLGIWRGIRRMDGPRGATTI